MEDEKQAIELFECYRQLLRGPIENVREVTKGEGALLTYLERTDRAVTPTEIKEAFQLSAARVANTLNSLEKKEYIGRNHDNEDRRKVYVHITDQGRRIVEEKQREAIHVLNVMLESLGKEDAEEYLRIMKKICVTFSELRR